MDNALFEETERLHRLLYKMALERIEKGLPLTDDELLKVSKRLDELIIEQRKTDARLFIKGK